MVIPVERVRLMPFLVLGALLAGCAGPSDEPIAPTSLDLDWNVSSRGTQELNFDMQEGGTIRFSINASAPVAWDLHSHDDETRKTVEHLSGEAREVNETFQASVDDTYSIAVRGTGHTAIVRLHVEGPFRVKV